MSALVTVGLAALCVLAWCACGLPAARSQAVLAYDAWRGRNMAPAYPRPQYGRWIATVVVLLCMAAGPLSLLLALADRFVGRTVPTLVEAEAKAKREELARLQEQIDQAHRDLGIRPLGGT